MNERLRATECCGRAWDNRVNIQGWKPMRHSASWPGMAWPSGAAVSVKMPGSSPGMTESSRGRDGSGMRCVQQRRVHPIALAADPCAARARDATDRYASWTASWGCAPARLPPARVLRIFRALTVRLAVASRAPRAAPRRRNPH
jgi:hypothetical protein